MLNHPDFGVSVRAYEARCHLPPMTLGKGSILVSFALPPHVRLPMYLSSCNFRAEASSAVLNSTSQPLVPLPLVLFKFHFSYHPLSPLQVQLLLCTQAIRGPSYRVLNPGSSMSTLRCGDAIDLGRRWCFALVRYCERVSVFDILLVRHFEH